MKKTACALVVTFLSLSAYPGLVLASAWTWVCYGDTRSQDSWHRQVLSALTTTSQDAQFIINVGDVVDPGDSIASWNTWQAACDDILGGTGQGNTPPAYMAVKGNHDEAGNPTTAQQNWRIFLPGQQRYGNDGNFFTFDYDNARFVLLDSYSPLAGPQWTLLQSAVLNNPPTWLFIIMHEPLFAYGGHPANAGENSTWGPLLYQHRCDLIFSGHNHHYLRTVKMALDGSPFPQLDPIRGAAQIITGNGGAPEDAFYTIDVTATSFTAQVAYPVSAVPNFYGYTELRVNGSTLVLRHFRLDGTIMDSATYTANSSQAGHPATATPPPASFVPPKAILAVPNPGKNAIRFKWDNLAARQVTIRVFKTSGELIVKLEQAQPGSREVTWDCRGVAPGVYYYLATITTADGKINYPVQKVAVLGP